ncbi:GNAT family N-acetyltransferase [Inediibacterium massiliense]|uniref:GNAT family N-acetyltransferase n=1 Tax=Inediibacterium massiliense TaxID=1658111 RepID=UPI0006B49D80|nr:GNAT family N-acetyltransferase [Inediibacterium massiliense]
MELKRGILAKHNGENRIQDSYIMRLIKWQEAEQAVLLQNFVYEQLINKQVLYTDSYENMIKDMKAGAKIIGVFNKDNELIAYRHIAFPGVSDRNLGNDIHLPENELLKVAHLERTVVHPDYRGNNLQSITLQEAVPLIKELGYRHLVCTVSPFNLFSLYNIIKNGLKIKALKEKYQTGKDTHDGLWRFILHRELEPVNNIEHTQSFSVSLNDFKAQEDLINDGFIGHWLFKESKLLNYVR